MSNIKYIISGAVSNINTNFDALSTQINQKASKQNFNDLSGIVSAIQENYKGVNGSITAYINNQVSGKADKSQLFSGSYLDLTDKPFIPTTVSDLPNDAGYLTAHQSLSAYMNENQTKTLVEDRVSCVMRWKGHIYHYAQLTAIVSPVVGDVYTVDELSGAEYMFTIASNVGVWERIGGGETIDVSKKADKTYVDTELAKKVDKVQGKQLTTEDFTTAQKNKLSTVSQNAKDNVIENIVYNGTQLVPVDKTVSITIDLSGKMDQRIWREVSGQLVFKKDIPTDLATTGFVSSYIDQNIINQYQLTDLNSIISTIQVKLDDIK